MGTKCNTNSTSQSEKDNANNKSNNNTNVVLNVYDLTPLNNYFYWFGFGIFHSGIQVHNKEYGFGAHDFPSSGVFEVEPRKCPGFVYRTSVNMGQVNIHPSEFRTFIENMASEYHGDTYHLISKNCNHFTDDIAGRLTGKRAPGWVNRLARLVEVIKRKNRMVKIFTGLAQVKILRETISTPNVFTPYFPSESTCSLCSCLLPDSIQVTTIKQLPEYHSEDEVTDSLSTATPCESMELDDEQAKRLLSSLDSTEDISFVKGTHVK